MIGKLFLNNELIGEINLEVIDKSMGVIGGNLICTSNYYKFKNRVQMLCAKKGIANSDDLPLEITVNDHIILTPEGGIGITDIEGFDEIYVDAAGLDLNNIIKVKK